MEGGCGNSHAGIKKESATSCHRTRSAITRLQTKISLHLSNRFLEGYHALLDVLFPLACVSCGEHGRWLCTICERAIGDDPGCCCRCGKRSLHGRTCALCQHTTPLSGVTVVGRYQDPILRSAVRALKFEGVRDLTDPLSTLLARKVQGALGSTLQNFTVIPLPLHPQRERLRGFNQAVLLAEGLGTRLSLPVRQLLRRTRHTSPQTSIDPEVQDRRRANIAGAFAYQPLDKHDLAPECVLLVDDVTTTGATLEEAARVLYHHGARTIRGAVVCRG